MLATVPPKDKIAQMLATAPTSGQIPVFTGSDFAAANLLHPGYPSQSLILPFGMPQSTATSNAFAADVVVYTPFVIYSPVSVDRIRYQITTGVSGATLRTLLYKHTAISGQNFTASLVSNLNTQSATSSATVTITPTSLTLQPGIYELGINFSTAVTLLCFSGSPARDDWPSSVSTPIDGAWGRRSMQSSLPIGTTPPATISMKPGLVGNYSIPFFDMRAA